MVCEEVCLLSVGEVTEKNLESICGSIFSCRYLSMKALTATGLSVMDSLVASEVVLVS